MESSYHGFLDCPRPACWIPNVPVEGVLNSRILRIAEKNSKMNQNCGINYNKIVYLPEIDIKD